MSGRTLTFTVLAMLAFAANSLLCRLALGLHLIDAASFTTIRAVSGALALAAISQTQTGFSLRNVIRGNPVTPMMLFAYMICFSFAYLSLSAGTGALILFGSVQLTMFIWALREGEGFSSVSWIGLGLAIVGLVYLVLPGVTAPDPFGAVLMGMAGVAWGVYSLKGRGLDPLQATTRNFCLAAVLALLTNLIFWHGVHSTPNGVALAVMSGAIASGCGYVIWYGALRGLTASRAATVQLSVPAIAAIGGAVILSEAISVRLVVATVAILGGIGIVLAQRAVHSELRR
ncbi:DMT family transporter [Aestuariivirga sp.]|uniref:DMT family transporter n=1 Tax=Aestuariivirga sp. TaxID=2650926 RepID=UPI00391B8472